jgi:hypothetical protein
VPRPRLHLIRFHGVLAPNAKLRREIVPSPPEQATAPACDHAQGAPARLSWARLLKRVFDIHRTLPELRRQLEEHRRHRRSAGDCKNPYSSGPADQPLDTGTSLRIQHCNRFSFASAQMLRGVTFIRAKASTSFLLSAHNLRTPEVDFPCAMNAVYEFRTYFGWRSSLFFLHDQAAGFNNCTPTNCQDPRPSICSSKNRHADQEMGRRSNDSYLRTARHRLFR